MLQILLAFLAISIVSVTGYGLMEQLSLQQIMLDQRENARRLDVAAEAIAGRLVTMPGGPGVFAPAPSSANTGWSAMPSDLGGINATVDGVPFVYCPIAPAAGAATSQVKSPDGTTYGIQIRGGVVVGSELGHGKPLNPGIEAYKPVAFIIAAGRGLNTPPGCDGVRERNGRPFIDHGIVKVVSQPGAIQGAGTVSSSSSEIFVASNGDGNGRMVGDPASIEDALRQWVNGKPASMTIHLVGGAGSSITVGDASLWAAFSNSLRASSSKLTIDGGNATLVAPVSQVGAPAVLSLSAVGIVGPTFVVEQGDELNVQNGVVLQPGTSGSGLFVQQGGRLNVSGMLRIAGSAQNGVEAAGDVTISTGGITGPGNWSLGLTNGGRLLASGAMIGDASARNAMAGLAVAGTWSVTSDASSRVAAAASGACWVATDNSDVTFAWSNNGPGSTSAVNAPPISPGEVDLTVPSEMAAYEQYRDNVNRRQRALQTNHSNFQCI